MKIQPNLGCADVKPAFIVRAVHTGSLYVNTTISMAMV